MPLWRSAVHPDKIIFTRGKFSRLRGTGEFAEARQSIVHRRTARERSCRMDHLARERHVAPCGHPSCPCWCQTVMYIAIELVVVNKDNSLVMRYRTGLQQLRCTVGIGRRVRTHCIGTVRGLGGKTTGTQARAGCAARWAAARGTY